MSILFDTLITFAVMAAHWAIKKFSLLLGMEDELSWINNISQDYYYIIFILLFIINILRLLKSEGAFDLSPNLFKQNKDTERRSNKSIMQEDEQDRDEVKNREV